MRLWIVLMALGLVAHAQGARVVCFYNAESYLRSGRGQMHMADLEPALQFCNYLVYGYAGIDATTYLLKSLQPTLDLAQNHYRTITMLKRDRSHLRMLLSVGGDSDLDNPHKYLEVLESPERRRAFVDSAVEMVHQYGFDGLDLAWQFPKLPPKVERGAFARAFHKVKTWFVGEKPLDPQAEDHKTAFTSLVAQLRLGLGGSDFTLTVLPHVDPELFLEPESILPHLDFVNLATFDFFTPQRDEKVADYPAPLYEPFDRDPTHNVNYQVQWWLNHTERPASLNLGVPAFGRAWVMSKDSGITGHPPLPKTKGPAPPGIRTLTPGLLSWPEVCQKMRNTTDAMSYETRLRKVGDPTRRYGAYAYRAFDDESEQEGIWVGYEDPESAANKAGYVRAKGLGGVALFDLSLDDFHGECAGERFPILRSIKYRL